MAFMADFIRIAGNKLLLSPNGKLALSDTCCCQHFDCLWACCEKDGAFQCLRADAPMFDCCNDIGGTTHGFFIGPCTETCAESWGGCTDCVPPCSGPCENSEDCAPGCVCVDGECVSSPCSGPCENSEDCAPGCFCVDGVCVESGACCLPGGACQSGLTQAECEECTPVNTCYETLILENPEDPCPAGWTADGFGGCSRTTNPASCDDCPGYCFTTSEGNCGTWVPGADCEASPCCSSVADCPEFDPECPGNPMACCDDVCTPHSCFPGIWIKMTFTKPVACDPATYPVLAHVNAGEQFDIVISGGTLVCEEFADLSSAPCNTTWRLSRGCILSNFNFDIVNVQTPQLCADCYSDLDSWSYGRNDPTGVTATPPGSWNPCP